MSVQILIPDAIVQAIRLPEDRISHELLIELSVSTYRQGLLSFGKARELAEIGKYDQAIEQFQKAIDLDPEFALAYAGKGEAFINYSAHGIIPNNEAYLETRKLCYIFSRFRN